MPEEVGPLRLPARQARTEHHIRRAARDRLDRSRDVNGVVFAVGVLDDHDVALDMRNRGPDRRSFPPLAGE